MFIPINIKIYLNLLKKIDMRNKKTSRLNSKRKFIKKI